MGYEFGTVDEADFMKIGEKPEFMKIEEVLVAIGGGGVAGTAFKTELVKKSGWRYPKLTSYGKDPTLAAQVFNKIKVALTKTDDKDQLLSMLAK